MSQRYTRKSAGDPTDPAATDPAAAAPAATKRPKALTKAEKAARAEEEAILAQAEHVAESHTAERAAAQEAKKADAPVSRRAKVDPKDFLDEDGVPLSRRSARGKTGNQFEIPEHLRKPGWDYEYKTLRVLNQPVDASEMAENYENGWRPVPAADMKELVPPGYESKHVERGGEVLMMRPMHLTQEARDEMIALAEEQRYEKLQGALAGPGELSKATRRITTEMELYGTAGRAERRAS